jgi:hypothetical protein
LPIHLARSQRQARWLVLGAYRPGEGELNPGLQHARIELTRLRMLTALTWGGWTNQKSNNWPRTRSAGASARG